MFESANQLWMCEIPEVEFLAAGFWVRNFGLRPPSPLTVPAPHPPPPALWVWFWFFFWDFLPQIPSLIPAQFWVPPPRFDEFPPILGGRRLFIFFLGGGVQVFGVPSDRVLGIGVQQPPLLGVPVPRGGLGAAAPALGAALAAQQRQRQAAGRGGGPRGGVQGVPQGVPDFLQRLELHLLLGQAAGARGSPPKKTQKTFPG